MKQHKKRVVVAMSGGVDSSVAAALLKEQGCEVIGISMQLYDHSDQDTRFDSCCSLKEVDGARRVAQILDIPYYVLNFEDVFKRKVIDYFVKEYLEARTPNPCVKCNEDVKFKHLLIKARELKADFLATGHYVKNVYDAQTRSYHLKKADDLNKDQSYFLFSMAQKELPFLLFPLGELTKSQVREIARAHGLPTADKKESMEICFIPDNNYASFISEKTLTQEEQKKYSGKILDQAGKQLGQHEGFFKYTIGQRKGLGVFQADPLYVTRVDQTTKDVTVGGKEDLLSGGLIAKDVNWLTLPRSPDISVRIRYRHKGVKAFLNDSWQDGSVKTDRIHVVFEEKQSAVTPGQAAVFYEGDTLLGGGWIAQSCH